VLVGCCYNAVVTDDAHSSCSGQALLVGWGRSSLDTALASCGEADSLLLTETMLSLPQPAGIFQSLVQRRHHWLVLVQAGQAHGMGWAGWGQQCTDHRQQAPHQLLPATTGCTVYNLRLAAWVGAGKNAQTHTAGCSSRVCGAAGGGPAALRLTRLHQQRAVAAVSGIQRVIHASKVPVLAQRRPGRGIRVCTKGLQRTVACKSGTARQLTHTHA
jgi:hypothetical protein